MTRGLPATRVSTRNNYMGRQRKRFVNLSSRKYRIILVNVRKKDDLYC